ncbi:lipid IV(A) palmitoyltransferase PagP [Enterobacter sp. RHB15-C17]|uniref:Lipid A acyltransferase PagP n=2 Tax=Enterobacteriaceae TaxID=543 RepID=A0ABY3NWM6_9ENTR|nr:MULTISPECIES: lipid IV(A) palmitoyltransferase PagP [Lelliottia]PKA32666.1 phospholipid:lipid A palmitoyltransferase [Cedecea lapagei]QMM53436.1 lipid IV(A) palmitoyltransferase PagP [Enterobacter sp. RHB15-C17]PLY47308.1 phospholipid:lipid A palmitoyltransferase [Lelliottia sp. F159]PLY51426.1 phospholipid:lipid A palmitoyltransferase [Lelliottia sp. F154]PLY54372.1 phospholipid:lipid A palmitoyltransferase [Lelliottia sp. F153]
MMHPIRIVLLIMLMWFVAPLYAEPGVYGEQRITGWWNNLTSDVSQTWNAPQNYDLYLPFLSWHARFMYDKEKTDKYNETPWGGGFGVSRYNEAGNWSSLYAMMFKDSHNEWQPIIGYGWEKGWYLDNARDFRLGLGVTAGITARQDFANYVPLPIILPLFSAGYKRLNVQFTYIPGTYNNGNVLFAWLRYGF